MLLASDPALPDVNSTRAAGDGGGIEPILRITDLGVRFDGRRGSVHAVRGVSLALMPGEVCALVGESGSGKSATGLALLGLHGPEAEVTGSIVLAGEEIAGADPQRWRAVRGRRIAMVFQNATAALNPLRTIGSHLIDVLRLDNPTLGRNALRTRAAELLEAVGIGEPMRRLGDYPHQFSGGMNQRVGIALALARQPDVLIADEPTTALDVSVQAQIVRLLLGLARDRHLAILFITHDLSLAAEMSDRVAVMYSGRVVEMGPTRAVFARPRHRYTEALLRSLPELGRHSPLRSIEGDPPPSGAPEIGCAFSPRCAAASEHCRAGRPALAREGEREAACYHPPAAADLDAAPREEVPRRERNEKVRIAIENLVASYPVAGAFRHRSGPRILDDVTLELRSGEVLGLVGESGSGKSTLARVLMGQLPPQAGRVLVDGVARPSLRSPAGRALAQRLQLVFQDSLDALDPAMTIAAQLEEPLRIAGRPAAQRFDKVLRTAAAVGLPAELLPRLPRQLSGGQRQRVVLARALMLDPDILICDEPVASLDVSVQAQVINLLARLRAELDLTVLFISHDLRLVSHLCDRVAIMWRGRIVETGAVDQIFANPQHAYTRQLLAALPRLERLRKLEETP